MPFRVSLCNQQLFFSKLLCQWQVVGVGGGGAMSGCDANYDGWELPGQLWDHGSFRKLNPVPEVKLVHCLLFSYWDVTRLERDRQNPPATLLGEKNWVPHPFPTSSQRANNSHLKSDPPKYQNWIVCWTCRCGESQNRWCVPVGDFWAFLQPAAMDDYHFYSQGADGRLCVAGRCQSVLNSRERDDRRVFES